MRLEHGNCSSIDTSWRRRIHPTQQRTSHHEGTAYIDHHQRIKGDMKTSSENHTMAIHWMKVHGMNFIQLGGSTMSLLLRQRHSTPCGQTEVMRPQSHASCYGLLGFYERMSSKEEELMDVYWKRDYQHLLLYKSWIHKLLDDVRIIHHHSLPRKRLITPIINHNQKKKSPSD